MKNAVFILSACLLMSALAAPVATASTLVQDVVDMVDSGAIPKCTVAYKQYASVSYPVTLTVNGPETLHCDFN